MQTPIVFIYFISIYKAPKGRNFRGAVSSQRWPKPSPVFIEPTHGVDVYIGGIRV